MSIDAKGYNSIYFEHCLELDESGTESSIVIAEKRLKFKLKHKE
jgi:hypothetical protein